MLLHTHCGMWGFKDGRVVWVLWTPAINVCDCSPSSVVHLYVRVRDRHFPVASSGRQQPDLLWTWTCLLFFGVTPYVPLLVASLSSMLLDFGLPALSEYRSGPMFLGPCQSLRFPKVGQCARIGADGASYVLLAFMLCHQVVHCTLSNYTARLLGALVCMSPEHLGPFPSPMGLSYCSVANQVISAPLG